MKSIEYFFKRKWEEHNKKEESGDKSGEKEEEPKKVEGCIDMVEVVEASSSLDVDAMVATEGPVPAAPRSG